MESEHTITQYSISSSQGVHKSIHTAGDPSDSVL